jgi:vacuolar-type H+-ATPase subunit I/STV1
MGGATEVGMVFRLLGWTSLVFGILLCLLGLASLPPGDLMFALPFFFLMPGIVLTMLGGLLLFFTRVKASTDTESRET